MPDMEKIIKGLECCVSGQPDGLGCSRVPCPYNQFEDCEGILHRDVIALLKAQEPRVMTLIEWIRAPEPADGECMCYEIKGEGLQAMLVKAFDGVRHLYGKAFRCWTSRPTDEQRSEVPWNS